MNLLYKLHSYHQKKNSRGNYLWYLVLLHKVLSLGNGLLYNKYIFESYHRYHSWPLYYFLG